MPKDAINGKNNKATIIRVSFRREDLPAYKNALQLARQKSLSDAAFCRLAINHYVEQIKSGKVTL